MPPNKNAPSFGDILTAVCEVYADLLGLTTVVKPNAKLKPLRDNDEMGLFGSELEERLDVKIPDGTFDKAKDCTGAAKAIAKLLGVPTP